MALLIESEETPSAQETMAAVWRSITDMYGEYGGSRSGLALLKYNRDMKLAVIRCSHKSVEIVRAAIALITSIGQKPAVFRVLGVSGTIRALHKRLDSLGLKL